MWLHTATIHYSPLGFLKEKCKVKENSQEQRIVFLVEVSLSYIFFPEGWEVQTDWIHGRDGVPWSISTVLIKCLVNL